MAAGSDIGWWRRRGCERVEDFVERLRTSHPGFGSDATGPVGEARNAAEVFLDVLFAYLPHWNDTASGNCEGATEESLQHEDAFRVVPERAVSEVGDD